jgi:glucans biosynthesis protein
LNRLDFDAYRDIRFRPDRALLAGRAGPFRMQLFHLGFLFQRARDRQRDPDGVPTPVAYQPQLFDYGRNRIERPLPVNLGFAGFRLHYQLNDPARPRRADRVPRRELFPLSRPRPALRPLPRGASSINVAGAEQPEGVPVLSRVLDREPAAGRRQGDDLRAASTAPARLAPYRFDVHPAVETTVDIGPDVVSAAQPDHGRPRAR